MNSEICKKAEFKITYEFNDPSLEFVGAHLIPGTTNSQNFYVIEKNVDGLKDEITGKIDTSKIMLVKQNYKHQYVVKMKMMQ